MKKAILDFIKNNVIGRQLETDAVTYYLDGGKLEGVYCDQLSFSDLLSTPTGLQFNMTTVTNEKVYLLDSDKKRLGLKKDFTGTSVFHYEIAWRKSTSQLTGYVRLLSSTVEDHTMEAVVYGVYDVRIEDDQLKWKEQQLLYRDMPSDGEVYHSVAFDSTVRLFQEDDKLRFEYIPEYFDVAPGSLVKTRSAEQYPAFVSKEK